MKSEWEQQWSICVPQHHAKPIFFQTACVFNLLAFMEWHQGWSFALVKGTYTWLSFKWQKEVHFPQVNMILGKLKHPALTGTETCKQGTKAHHQSLSFYSLAHQQISSFFTFLSKAWPGNPSVSLQLVGTEMVVCAKSYLTLYNPMYGSPSGSSVHGILQSRILEWVAMPSSRGSSQPRTRTCISYISCIGRRGFLS